MKTIFEFRLVNLFPVALAAVIIGSLNSCSKSGPIAAAVSNTPDTISTVALTYLDSALDIMQEFSFKRFQIDWTEFRKKVLSAAADAQSVPVLMPRYPMLFNCWQIITVSFVPLVRIRHTIFPPVLRRVAG